jgi:hypothetical protein
MYLQKNTCWLRYSIWLEYSRKDYQNMGISHILLLDDGSDEKQLKKLDLPIYRELPEELPKASIFTFSTHLGRPEHHNFLGWWRSFLLTPVLAERYGFDKLLHIESDAYVLSQQLRDYLAKVSSGWTALWCPHYEMPETAIQVICRDQFNKMKDFVPPPNTDPEMCLPFTCVNKDFIGDRYGEYGPNSPLNIDYYCQRGGHDACRGVA